MIHRLPMYWLSSIAPIPAVTHDQMPGVANPFACDALTA